MQIHVVLQGETIATIADRYGISAEKIILDNEIRSPGNLVVGQSLVIAFPEQTYTVQEGDTLQGIADSTNITLEQLYRNNPVLVDREYIYPGETLVISYNNTKGQMTIHGNLFPFINRVTLRKALPYLTYASVINYTATREGDVLTYYDDSEVLAIIKDYGVMPLMLLTTLTIQGEANIGIEYDILLSEDFQNKQIENILTIIKNKGYYGINISFQYINITTIGLYERYLANIYQRLNQEGYYVFVTISPGDIINEITLDPVNYSIINQLTHNIIFNSYEWFININPPSPITSISDISIFLDYISTIISPDKVIIGIPTIGYDWQLPFVAGISRVNLLSYTNAVEMARNVGAIIQFDETSQTPYYIYYVSIYDNQIQHIVWFIDARSINSLLDLANERNLLGTGIWNIMENNPQLWLLINTQYEIIKVMS
ncbi:MAG: hypothetical protein K0S76_2134 [Herbinix sp.]|jgi:spore germination protein|nr:hypothetical protein [Herbinix sp.]